MMASRESTSTFGVLNDPVSLVPEPIVEMSLSKEQLHERSESNESHCNDYNNNILNQKKDISSMDKCPTKAPQSSDFRVKGRNVKCYINNKLITAQSASSTLSVTSTDDEPEEHKKKRITKKKYKNRKKEENKKIIIKKKKVSTETKGNNNRKKEKYKNR